MVAKIAERTRIRGPNSTLTDPNAPSRETRIRVVLCDVTEHAPFRSYGSVTARNGFRKIDGSNERFPVPFENLRKKEFSVRFLGRSINYNHGPGDERYSVRARARRE